MSFSYNDIEGNISLIYLAIGVADVVGEAG